jgi:hypothetical protein
MWALLLFLMASFAYAEQPESPPCEEVIMHYEKEPLVASILILRGSAITVEMEGWHREMLGAPDLKFISPRSICTDLTHLGISASDFVAMAHARPLSQTESIEQRESSMATTLESGPEKAQCEDGEMAQMMAKDFVEEQLKASATVTFPRPAEAKKAYLGRCRHQVLAYVDSDNGAGAQTHTQYSATVRYVGHDQWSLDDLQFIKP